MLLQITETAVEMADLLRSNGKIYVVLAVVLIIFAGIVFFMIFLEGRLTRLEKEIDDYYQQKQSK